MPTGSTVVAEGSNNFLVPNATIIVEFIAFAIVIYLIYKYVVPVVSKSMTERQETIRKQIDDSREAKERLEAAEAEYKQALADNRTEAARIREEARAQGQQIIDEMRHAAQEEAERISERERGRMDSERQQMIHQLRAEVGQIAVELAGRVVGESLSDEARQSRIVDRFLAELDESADASAAGADSADGADGSAAEKADPAVTT